MSAGRGRLVEGLAVGALLLIVLVLPLVAARDEVDRPGSVADRGGQGRRLLRELVRELGFDSVDWHEPPGRLVERLPRGALLVQAHAPRTLGLEAPEGEPDGGLREAEGVALLGALHDPLGYARFVGRGGTLVLPLAESETFLARHLDLAPFADLEDEAGTPGEPETLRLHLDGSRESFTLRLARSPALERAVERGRLRPVLLEAGGAALGAALELERGRVVVLADDSFLSSEALRDPGSDAPLLAVRLFEDLAGPGGTVAFDEYALGRWEPVGAAELALGPAFAPVTLHALLLVLLIVWRRAWVREFPRAAPDDEGPSPLARARAGARLHLRADRAERLADLLREGIVLAVARELHVVGGRLGGEQPAGDPDGDGDAAELLRERTRERLARVLERVERSEELEAWSARLLEGRVRDVRGLERLARELEEWAAGVREVPAA